MRIAVCDDDKVFLDEIKNAVFAHLNMRGLTPVIDEYTCGEDLLNSAENYDIIFLDYRLEGINGLETARILRRNNINCVIIFLTSFPHFVYESFEVGTYRFFKKPLDKEKLNKALDNYIESFESDYPLLLKVGRETVRIQSRTIVFLEADNKKCYINLVNERVHCAKTMTSLSELLPQTIFHKINKAFIVNFDHISSYDKEFVYFENGMRAPISRKYFSSFKEAFRNYAKDRSI